MTKQFKLIRSRDTYRERVELPCEENLLAFQRVVKLPLDIAVLYEAAQNFDIDVAAGYHVDRSQWMEVKESYMQDAGMYLEAMRRGYYPGFNDLPWFHVENTIGNVPVKPPAMRSFLYLPTHRSEMLLAVFNHVYSLPESKVKKNGWHPDPRIHNEFYSIEKLMQEILIRNTYH